MNIKKLLVIAFTLIIPHYLLVIPCNAQQITLSLDPPIVETHIKPGKSILVAYTIENKGDPTPLQFFIRPFTPQGQEGALAVGKTFEGPILFSLENTDVSFEKPFFFKSNEKKQAVVKIQIPDGIPEGDYYYIFLAETVPSFSSGGQTTGIASASIGSPLLINVTQTGITQAKGTIAEFSIKPTYQLTFGKKVIRIVDTGIPIPLILSVRNAGNTMIDPQGTISVRSGKKATTYELLPQHILSNSQRILKINPPSTETPSNQTMLLSGLSIGKNIISASLSFGENTPILLAQTDCIGIPIRLFLLMGVVLCISGLTLFFVSKNKPLKE